jgi:hypothetical protein
MKRPILFHVLFATAFSVVLICSALARQGTKMDTMRTGRDWPVMSAYR